MDPASVVGLVSGVAALAKLVDGSLSGLSEFISQSRRVDQTVQSFHDDIEALSMAITAVSARFRSRGGSTLTLNSPASREAAEFLSISVVACQRLMQRLETYLPSRRSSGGGINYFQRLLLQRRMNHSRESIRVTQGQIQMHTSIINTAFNLLIFDCITQSPQGQAQDVTQPYNNLVGSLAELQRERRRLPSNSDPETVVAVQNARALSNTATTSISGSASVVGRQSTQAGSRSPPTSSPGTQQPVPEAAPPNVPPQHTRSRNTRSPPSVSSPPRGTQSASEGRAHTRYDSGYGSQENDDADSYFSSIPPVSPDQMRLETQRLLQSHGHPISRVRPLTISHAHKKALYWAATEGHLMAVKYLIDRATPFDLRNETGLATLISAIEAQHTEVVKFLLSLISQAEFTGTPQAHDALLAAVRSGDYAVSAILLDKGANPNSRKGNQATALHPAAERGYLSLVKQLLLKDGDVYAKDEDKRTPLHAAVTAGSVAVTRILLQHRAEVNVKNSEGDTPFHIAFRSGELEIFNSLIECGAKMRLTNDDFVRSTTLDQLLGGKLAAGFHAFVKCLHRQNLLTLLRIEEIVYYIARGNYKDALNYLCNEGVLTGPHSQEKPVGEDFDDSKKAPFLPNKISFETLGSLPAYEQYYRYNGVDVLYRHQDTLADQHGRNEQALRRAVDANNGRGFRDTLEQMNPGPGHPHWPISAETLCHVVKQGDLGMLHALFWTKVDINGRDSTGWAAIHYAADTWNMYDKLVTLHSAGADINLQTSAFRDKHEKGATALSLAFRQRAECRDQRSRDYWDTVCLALHTRGANAVAPTPSSRELRPDNAAAVPRAPSTKKCSGRSRLR
ncbi:Ankyrin repeat-containing protein [Cladophialophora immunda]|nr:Ankyrin repeat-containing protein [Cladophialophora immunda]